MARKSIRQAATTANPDTITLVKEAARGRWAAVLSAVAGLSVDILDRSHHPCPKCGGTDRFRFTDQGGDGSCICNACARRTCGDGLATILWATGWTFAEALRRVAQHLGISQGPGGGLPTPSTNGKANVDPAEHLEFLPWNPMLVAFFCAAKPPIKPEAIRAVGGRLARYRNQFIVIALPVVGKELDHARPVGWVLYNVTGGVLPCWKKDGSVEYKKIKTTPGTGRGLIGVFRQ